MQKRFGQNFLVNPSARINLINRLNVEKGDEVWEIGAGLGAMTALLLERGARVRAFEVDRGFCAVLKELFADEAGFVLVEGDVLETWTEERARSAAAPLLLGNLPYNIGARVLGGFIEGGFFFRRILVTVQREVARRIAAKPADKDYSSLSALASRHYHTKLLSVLKGASFFPAPRVESQAVLLELKEGSADGEDPAEFASVVRALFSSRRKTVKNNLAAFLKAPACDAAAALQACGIAPDERAERLTPDDFARLTLFCSSGLPGGRP
jgi:16S rRNA (adenine1518-N6/adenine1519-N6)-dimethyltransferase